MFLVAMHTDTVRCTYTHHDEGRAMNVKSLATTTAAVDFVSALWRNSGAHPSTTADVWTALSELSSMEQHRS